MPLRRAGTHLSRFMPVNGPRLCSAPLREELGAALRPGRERHGLVGPPTYAACSHLQKAPPMTPPMIEATQHNHHDPSAAEPPKIAVAVDRAGLSEALDTGMATR